MASAIAGTATFLAAVYLGMILFSPDSSSAGTPDHTPSSGPSQEVGGGERQPDPQDGERNQGGGQGQGNDDGDEDDERDD